MIMTFGENEFVHVGQQKDRSIQAGDFISREEFPGSESTLYVVTHQSKRCPGKLELAPFWGVMDRALRIEKHTDSIAAWHRWEPRMVQKRGEQQD